MKHLEREQQQMLANTFDALGHKRRIEIFKQLSRCKDQQLNFGQLCALCDLTPAIMSFHLKKMQKGGLVTRKQIGNTTLISLKADHLQIATAMMANN